MSKDLQPIPPSSLAVTPANVVNQTGEKNVHIDHVDNLEQKTTVIQIVNQNGGNRRPTTQTISTRYYHLFVMGGETFEQDYFIVPADRAIGGYWTSEEVRQQHAALSDESIEELKTYPALFLPETDGYYAKAGAEQYAHFGLVTDIRVQDNGIKIKMHIIWSLPLQDIANIGFNLGMKDMDKAIGELNRTHWAIKRINLIEEFKDAGISIFGIT